MKELPQIPEHYILLEVLGAGGQAKVIRAYDQKTGQFIALKITIVDLTEKPLEKNWRVNNIFAETKLLSSLSQSKDQRALKLIDYFFLKSDFQKRSDYCLVVEYGFATLNQGLRLLMRKAVLSEEQCIYVCQSIIEAYDAINKEGVCHRDLKPENIILIRNEQNGDFSFKISDFGLAIKPQSSEISIANIWGLTPFYGSPEVEEVFQQKNTQPNKKYNAEKGDIYSLGITFLQTMKITANIFLNWRDNQEKNGEKLPIHYIHSNEDDLNKKYPNILTIIKKMIEPDHKKRPNFEEVKKMWDPMKEKAISPDFTKLWEESNKNKNFFIEEERELDDLAFLKRYLNYTNIYITLGKGNESMKFCTKALEQIKDLQSQNHGFSGRQTFLKKEAIIFLRTKSEICWTFENRREAAIYEKEQLKLVEEVFPEPNIIRLIAFFSMLFLGEKDVFRYLLKISNDATLISQQTLGDAPNFSQFFSNPDIDLKDILCELLYWIQEKLKNKGVNIEDWCSELFRIDPSLDEDFSMKYIKTHLIFFGVNEMPKSTNNFHLFISWLFYHGNHLDMAEYLCLKALKIHQENEEKFLIASAWKRLGLIYRRKGKLHIYYKNNFKDDPNQSDLYYLNRAINAFETALTHEKDLYGEKWCYLGVTYWNLAKLYLSLKDIQKSLEYLRSYFNLWSGQSFSYILTRKEDFIWKNEIRNFKDIIESQITAKLTTGNDTSFLEFFNAAYVKLFLLCLNE